MRKTYPKVPRHDHDTVDESLYSADDLVMLEKMDGSNLRLCLYDERYADLYGDSFDDHDPSDGDVFIASKNVVRGTLSGDPDELDGNFRRLLSVLDDALNREALRACHDGFNSPLVLFGEHMVKHTLDYGYGDDPPPAFLGFDVFRLADYEAPPENPFDERFDGFLDLDEAFDVFDRVGLETVPVVDEPNELDPNAITVPMSSHGRLQAEGVVIRSDARDRRVKYVTEQFRERQQEAWGMNESDADSGAELFAARYLTNARIRKQVNKLVRRGRVDEVDVSTVARASVADAWEEELYDIRVIGIGLCPRDVYPLAHDRCREVLDTMKTNAHLNGTTLDDLWADFDSDPGEDTLTTFDVDTTALSAVTSDARDADDVHDALARAFVDESDIHSTAESLAADVGRDIGRWVVEDTYESLRDDLWYDNLDLIANLPVEFVPADLNEALMEYVTDELEGREDVEVDEKPEDWTPDPSDAETGALGDFL